MKDSELFKKAPLGNALMVQWLELGAFPAEGSGLSQGGKIQQASWSERKTLSVLFTVANTWKQPKCPPTGDWFKMCVCAHSGVSLSLKRMTCYLYSNVDGPREYHTMRSKRQILYDITYMKSKK